MKKYIVTPLGICLILIVLSGFYIFRKYEMQLDARKELMVSYVSQTKKQLEFLESQVKTLPYIVKPFLHEIDLRNTDITEKYVDDIQMLENFYDENNYFIKGISVYNSTNGDVLNLFRDDNDRFIIDVYNLHIISDLQSEMGIVYGNKTFLIVVPVYENEILTGNVKVDINMMSLQHELYKDYLENDNLWPTSILGEETALTFPLENELNLFCEKDIILDISEKKSDFIHCRIKGLETSCQVVTYYESLMFSEYNLGIAFSSNISPLIVSSILSFVVVFIILLAITIVASYKLNRIISRNREIIINKDNEIKILRTIYQNAPVGIIVNRDNSFFSGNDCFFTQMEGYISDYDAGKNMNQLNFPFDYKHESEKGYTLCKFESNGKQICLSKQHTSFVSDESKYVIDTYWDVTEMEQNLNDSVQSAITKSKLLNRISGNIKKTLDKVRESTVVLMQQYPDEVRIASIIKSIAELSVMLKEVQDYADIEAGHVELVEIPFNISDEVKKLIYKHYMESQPRGVEIQRHFTNSALFNVVGDPQRFSQILNELLNNAIKFTNKGSISVSLETIDLHGGKTMVKCSVDDTGPGMPREKIKNLFSFESRIMEESSSFGLGIIIVKKLVQLMGGALRVASPSSISTDMSAPGMRFSFSFVCLPDQPSVKQLDFSSIVSNNQINVLLITLDTSHVKSLKNFFNRKDIHADVFIHNKDSDELLLQKLVIDRDRYKMAVILTSNNDVSFAIAEKIHSRKLTDNCIYAFYDANNKIGNYTRAKSLNMDYYIVKNNDLTIYDSILSTHFPNLKSEI